MLVVVAIVGLLASVVLSSLNSSREKAVVAAQLQIVEEYKKALDLYYFDNNGVYPKVDFVGPWNGTACMADYVGDECVYAGTRYESPALNTALNSYISSRTPLKRVHDTTFNFDFDGPIYTCQNFACSFLLMEYAMPGNNQPCGFGITGANIGNITMCQLYFQQE